MAIKQQLVALYTLVRRELVRMFNRATYWADSGCKLPHVHRARFNYDVGHREFLRQCLDVII